MKQKHAETENTFDLAEDLGSFSRIFFLDDEVDDSHGITWACYRLVRHMGGGQNGIHGEEERRKETEAGRGACGYSASRIICLTPMKAPMQTCK
jgi:hypothetical protein